MQVKLDWAVLVCSHLDKGQSKRYRALCNDKGMESQLLKKYLRDLLRRFKIDQVPRRKLKVPG